MPQVPARMSTMGRVVVPKSEREALGLEKGDYVLLDVTPLPDEDVDDD